jgi:methylated-DNA-[protein]-cysteine S-methyltransferase
VRFTIVNAKETPVIAKPAQRPLHYDLHPSPLGELLLLGDGEALRGLHLQHGPSAIEIGSAWQRKAAPFAAARAQLGEYFAGERTRFSLPLAPTGTEFQRRVWAALAEIPYGTTIDYGELARRIGRPGAARAVGAANGRNPISIIVPCHRVVGAGGALTGYSGGLERKRLLLELEGGRSRSADADPGAPHPVERRRRLVAGDPAHRTLHAEPATARPGDHGEQRVVPGSPQLG